ncbi:MAG: 50S ribosomal protein L17 [bacterium]|nr:50S ribosomal protein L17 [bacterium]
MRHRIAHKKLNRTSAHRRALRRNLAQSLFEHGQIRTTLEKARDLQPFAERLITISKSAAGGGSSSVRLSARRRLYRLLGDRAIIPADHRGAYDLFSDAKRARVLRAPSGRRHRTGAAKGRLEFTAESVTHRLIETIAPRYQERDGGYTRVIRLGERRVGDHAPLAVLQLVGDERSPGSIAKPRKTSRRRKADARYAFVVKLAKGGGSRAPTSEASPVASSPAAAPDPDEAAPDTPAEE